MPIAYGIAGKRPPGLERLPPFVGDTLKTEWSHGELCVQACADDPQVAVHAVRNLTRIAFGRAAIRWSQMGFGRTSKTTIEQQTPRNLMGFKDGTNNILVEDNGAVEEHVWLGSGDRPSWMAGGTLPGGRARSRCSSSRGIGSGSPSSRPSSVAPRAEGAPLSGGGEFTEPDFDAEAGGAPAIDPAAHIRLAHPSNNDGTRILRRGYNYVDGNNELRPPRRRTLLPLVPALAGPVHRPPAVALDRYAQRVHPPHRIGHLRCAPGCLGGRLRGRDALQLTGSGAAAKAALLAARRSAPSTAGPTIRTRITVVIARPMSQPSDVTNVNARNRARFSLIGASGT